MTASEERKAGFGLNSGRGIIDPGEVFLGVGVGASGCGEEANFSRRLPNWSSCSRAAGEPFTLMRENFKRSVKQGLEGIRKLKIMGDNMYRVTKVV